MSITHRPNRNVVRMTHAEWVEEGNRRFGTDTSKWKFVCPGCKYVASVDEYAKAGAPEECIGFNCIGRYLPACRSWMSGDGPGPCDYAGSGLFRIHPVIVDFNGEDLYVFAFAEVEDLSSNQTKSSAPDATAPEQ